MGKYKQIGPALDRNSRNDLNANFDEVDKNIQEQKDRVNRLITESQQPDEVVDARGEANTLGERLIGFDEQLVDDKQHLLGKDTSKKLSKGIISFTLDNSFASTFTKAYPEFKNRGMKFAVSPVADSFASAQKSITYYNYDNLKEMVDYGAEIIAHGMTGLDLTASGVDLGQAKYEIQECKKFWNKLGFKVNGYCGTNSRVHADYKNYLKMYDYAFSDYWTEKSVDQSVVDENTDIYGMGRHSLYTTYSNGGVQAIKNEIDYVEVNGVWLNYYNHQIDTGLSDSITLADFVAILDYALTKNIDILLPTEAVNRLNTKLIAGENVNKIRSEMVDQLPITHENILLNPRFNGGSAIPTSWSNRDTTVGGLTKSVVDYTSYNGIKYVFDTTNNVGNYVGLSQVVPLKAKNKADILTFSIDVDSNTSSCDFLVSLSLQDASSNVINNISKTVQLISGKKSYEFSMLVPKSGYTQLAFHFNFYPKSAVAMTIEHSKPKLEFSSKRTSWLPTIEQQTSSNSSISISNVNDNSATPDVNGKEYLYVINPSATTITNFVTSAYTQEITLFFGNTNTTIKGTGYIRLPDGQDYTPTMAGSVLTLFKHNGLSSAWHQKSRTNKTV